MGLVSAVMVQDSSPIDSFTVSVESSNSVHDVHKWLIEIRCSELVVLVNGRDGMLFYVARLKVFGFDRVFKISVADGELRGTRVSLYISEIPIIQAFAVLFGGFACWPITNAVITRQVGDGLFGVACLLLSMLALRFCGARRRDWKRRYHEIDAVSDRLHAANKANFRIPFEHIQRIVVERGQSSAMMGMDKATLVIHRKDGVESRFYFMDNEDLDNALNLLVEPGLETEMRVKLKPS